MIKYSASVKVDPHIPLEEPQALRLARTRNKFLLEDDDTKVFLGFGKSFSRYCEYFEEYLKPRVSCGMGAFVSRAH
jgi:hypothetical protein